jgi:Fic family protein
MSIRFWIGVASRDQVRWAYALLDGFEGHPASSKWAAMAKCSPDSALRDISQLLELGVLRRSPGAGRSTKYELSEG